MTIWRFPLLQSKTRSMRLILQSQTLSRKTAHSRRTAIMPARRLLRTMLRSHRKLRQTQDLRSRLLILMLKSRSSKLSVLRLLRKLQLSSSSKLRAQLRLLTLLQISRDSKRKWPHSRPASLRWKRPSTNSRRICSVFRPTSAS